MSVASSRQAFLDALRALLSRGDETGVNAVAREAGLNKVLLYRYFGSWEAFLDEWARSINPWRDLRIEAEEGLKHELWPTEAAFLKWLFRRYLDRLQNDALLQTILRRSLVDQNPLQSALEADREREGQALLTLFLTHFRSSLSDPASMAAILMGGLTWVSLVGIKTGTFSGLSFREGDGFSRLASGIDDWVDRLTGHSSSPIL